MRKLYIPIIILLVGMLSSCERFLDIDPKGQLTQDKMFDNVQGFRDAMYGVYATMAEPKLYGENLTWGFTDQIGQMFYYNNPEKVDVQIIDYKYMNTNVREVIDGIWAQTYTTISFVNNVIENLEITKLVDSDLQLIKGEAYGLRAFLHFDLLRLFAGDYQRDTKRNGIPYALHYDLNNKDLLTLDQAYQQILKDLDIAETELTKDNSIWNEGDEALPVYKTKRYTHFNKYAVYALKARVYHAMGDWDNAAKYARMVIDNTENFSLSAAEVNQIKLVKRYPADHEMIFGLYSNALTNVLQTTFIPNVRASGQFTQGRRDLDDIYETSAFTAESSDLRFSTFYNISDGGDLSQFTRLVADTDDKISGITLIRLPEMYYILSESLYDTNRNEAIETLNAVRKSRGLSNLQESKYDTKEHFIQELLRERMREMPGEGQIFFAYKHYNIPFKSIKGVTVAPKDEIFVLPWPDAELEFGITNNN